MAVAATPNEGFRIHVVNVGQGDCILVEFDVGCYLIDGGRGQTIRDSYEKAPNRNIQHTLNKLDCLAACKCPNKLRGIIITHPDIDHYEGVIKIIEWICKQPITYEFDILITEAFDKQIKQQVQSTKHNEMIVNSRQLEQVFGAQLKCHFNVAKGVLLTRKSLSSCSHPTREKLPPDNLTSIITTINEHEVVLTGDSTGDIIEKQIGIKGKHLKLFQVPHHASKNNSDYKFYKMFRADIYLISAGGRKFGRDPETHPHGQVLTDIITVNVERKTPCIIVVTNSYGLSKDKLSGLPPGWWEWVPIYHANALVDYRDKEAPRSQQWVTLNPNPYKKEFIQQCFETHVPQFVEMPRLPTYMEDVKPKPTHILDMCSGLLTAALLSIIFLLKN